MYFLRKSHKFFIVLVKKAIFALQIIEGLKK